MKYEVLVDGQIAWTGEGPDEAFDRDIFPAEYRARPGSTGAADGDEFTLLTDGNIVAVNTAAPTLAELIEHGEGLRGRLAAEGITPELLGQVDDLNAAVAAQLAEISGEPVVITGSSG